jgi:hypothetical protein
LEGAVVTGQPGIEGLARALGSGQGADKRPADRETESPAKKERKKKKRDKIAEEARKRSESEEETKDQPHCKQKRTERKEKRAEEGDSLREELTNKAPPEPRLSALDLPQKKKKKKEDKKKKKSRSSSSDSIRPRSPSSSSSSGLLFHSAALPRGMERLRRLHQKHPGSLASVTLLRMQELVHRAQGRGAAEINAEKLPPVAMSYVAGVFLVQNPPAQVGVRNLRELKTVATVIDMLCQNDAPRALDVLVQRLKALELAHKQQGWAQASQLELVLDDDLTAVFRPELKAAQSEVKEEMKIQRGPFRPQRQQTTWTPTWTPKTGDTDAKGEDAEKDLPPNNQPKGGGKKGKGKGKKGRFGRR